MGFLVRRLDDNGSHCFSEISISISTSSDNNKSSSLSFPRDVYAPFPESNHTVVGYCKGLFCLEYDDGKIVVWNPATREFKILPPSDMKLSSKAHVISRVRGLGFDPASGDYKVVRFVSVFSSRGDAKRAEVYSLKDDCWKEIDVPRRLFDESDIIDDYAICMDGVCLWKGVVMSGREPIFVRLDLADDRFSTKPFPIDRYTYAAIDIHRDHCVVMEFDGALGLIMYKPWYSCHKFLRYWASVVHEDGRHRWLQLLPLEHSVRAERPLGYCTAELLLLEDYDAKLLVYDSVTQELNKIDHIFDHPHTMQLFPYVETTISLQTLIQISPTPTPTPTFCIFDIKRYMHEEKIANEEKRECIRKRKEEKSANKEICQWITREIKKRRRRIKRRITREIKKRRRRKTSGVTFERVCFKLISESQ